MNKLGVKVFLERLKIEGLPHTKPTLLAWEKRGIIKKPKQYISYGSRNHRVYSEEEIRLNIQRVKDHINNRK